ncbi:hypothetical protein FNV43_RR05597 [Rhamnella rubrinervis]|uniref:Core Histone H2A/H2B/H3 domain-containing protein n=1 Tax=Rhamnella rubrinervis TaxID=2594499 RepID=A0A8K0MR92_9ROSA|nr:hypothetical protein FNV43_RR05597 [Rhamnella rubrinervis]
MAPKRSAKVTAVKATKKVVQETMQVAVVQTTTTRKQQEEENKTTREATIEKTVQGPKEATTTTTTSQKQEAAQEGAENKKSGTRRGRRRRSEGGGGRVGYGRYVYRVMKQVHPGMRITSKALTILNNLIGDVFERLAEEASRLTKYTVRMTLTSREIQGAVRRVLPGELGRHAIAEGVKTVTTYMSNDSTEDPHRD